MTDKKDSPPLPVCHCHPGRLERFKSSTLRSTILFSLSPLHSVVPLPRAFLSWRRPHGERHRPWPGLRRALLRRRARYACLSLRTFSSLPSPSCCAKSNTPNPNVWLFEFGSDHVFYLLPSIFLQKIIGCGCARLCPMLGPPLVARDLLLYSKFQC